MRLALDPLSAWFLLILGLCGVAASAFAFGHVKGPEAARRLVPYPLFLAGMALTDAALYAEIIGDLMHVGGDAIDLALKARTPRGLCLVSDALQGAGTGCNHFHANGRDHVIHDGAAYYPPKVAGDPPKLAGSALSQLEMVRRLVSRGYVSLADALTMASTTPAEALGLACGRIAVGAPADLVVLRGAELALEAVYVGGVRAT
jgi:N-acetylglucosamine-6-phosphate deacetylase